MIDALVVSREFQRQGAQSAVHLCSFANEANRIFSQRGRKFRSPLPKVVQKATRMRAITHLGMFVSGFDRGRTFKMPNFVMFVSSALAAFPLIKPAGGIPTTSSRETEFAHMSLSRLARCPDHGRRNPFHIQDYIQPTTRFPPTCVRADSHLRPRHAAQEQTSKPHGYPMPQRTV